MYNHDGTRISKLKWGPPKISKHSYQKWKRAYYQYYPNTVWMYVICSYPKDLRLDFRHLLKKLTSPTMLDIYYRTSSEIPFHLWFWSVHNIVMLHLSPWISFDVTCMHISLHLFYPESWKSVMSIMEKNLTHTETQLSWCLRFFSIKKS